MSGLFTLRSTLKSRIKAVVEAQIGQLKAQALEVVIRGIGRVFRLSAGFCTHEPTSHPHGLVETMDQQGLVGSLSAMSGKRYRPPKPTDTLLDIQHSSCDRKLCIKGKVMM